MKDTKKIRLVEDVHITWCPKGTEGILINSDFSNQFFPNPLPEGCPWTDGIFIGDKKYEEVK